MSSRKSSFDELVYEAVCRIEYGRVSTYGRIAEQCGSPRAARAVGMALHRNPRPGEIPCHRVVNRMGRLAPGFAFGGPDEQRKLLEKEGVEVSREGYVDLSKYLGKGRV
ncbi:MAG: MGMT family protein [Clostridia bacterium]|nr:MGMT family protein [Oscillospiraceae bacterium]MBQ6796890.1 MGMT family protein [Clostridia bacterium]